MSQFVMCAEGGRQENAASVNNLGEQEKTWAKLIHSEIHKAKPPDRNLLFEKSSFMMQRK